MRVILITLILSIANFALNQSRNYGVIELDSLYYRALTNENIGNSEYFELGYFVINKSNSNSYYVEKKIVETRCLVGIKFNIEVEDNFFNETLIPLFDLNSSSDLHLASHRHFVPFIKYKGLLIVMMNEFGTVRSNVSFNTGINEFDKKLIEIFNLINLCGDPVRADLPPVNR